MNFEMFSLFSCCSLQLATNYYSVIKQPIDMQTIAAKVQRDQVGRNGGVCETLLGHSLQSAVLARLLQSEDTCTFSCVLSGWKV